MTVTATQSASAASSAIGGNSAYSSLNMTSFVQLMATEMKNQDPTQPVDETQMIGQMAQFSQLAGVNDTNSTLKTMATTLNSILAAQQAAASPKTSAA